MAEPGTNDTSAAASAAIYEQLPCALGSLADTLPPNWQTVIDVWLQEDLPALDVVAFIVGSRPDEATLWQKAEGVLAGVPFFTAIFERLGCTVEWRLPEGTRTAASGVARQSVATVRGPARAILQGERTALNLLARCSGIATRSRDAFTLARKHQWHGQVAGTRKTTPGFRLVEKYGLLVGGADTHRYDLSAMVMLKDNAIWSSGNIAEAVKRARRIAGFSVKIEVECSSLADAEEAIGAGADIVMIDNHQPSTLHPIAAAIKAKSPHIIVEASGGITLENLALYFSPHVDVISLGLLTQSVPHIDFSLKIVHDESK